MSKKTDKTRNKPTQEWRVAVFNQIFTTRYYHIRLYELNPKTLKWHYTDNIYGRRGLGNNLGYTSDKEAQKVANEFNKTLGWR